jgi:hypothetical protein
MVFDVESIGLHGEGYAFGSVVIDDLGRLVSTARHACDPAKAAGIAEDRRWVSENVPPIYITCDSPFEVRYLFWQIWQNWRRDGAILVADCAWPVESRFLCQCVDDDPDNRRWQGPYPLHDLASIRLAAGLDPLATEARLANELPVHDPLADARQSARLLMEAIRKSGGHSVLVA